MPLMAILDNQMVDLAHRPNGKLSPTFLRLEITKHY